MRTTKRQLKRIIKEGLLLGDSIEIEDSPGKKHEIYLNENVNELQNLLRLLQETLTAASTIRPDIALTIGPIAADLRAELEQFKEEAVDFQDLEEQDEIAGSMEPLGTGTPKQRRMRRRNAIRANAEAFGGTE